MCSRLLETTESQDRHSRQIEPQEVDAVRQEGVLDMQRHRWLDQLTMMVGL